MASRKPKNMAESKFGDPTLMRERRRDLGVPFETAPLSPRLSEEIVPGKKVF
jgi:hypothetical protein